MKQFPPVAIGQTLGWSLVASFGSLKGPERKPWQLSEVQKEGKDQDNVEVLGTKPDGGEDTVCKRRSKPKITTGDEKYTIF